MRGDHPRPQPNPAAGVDREDRLAAILEQFLQLQQRPAVARPVAREFKIPEYDGTGDVGYFIRQAQDIIMANQWADEAALLHLRHSLKGIAQDCGKPETLPGVFHALQTRFGMSVSEARMKLAILKKEPSKSLHAHASTVEELMEAAHPDLPLENKRQMTLDFFQTTLDNVYLQGQLLAVRPHTLEEAVTRGNEFLRLKASTRLRPHVRQVEEEDETEELERPATQPVQTSPIIPDWAKALQQHLVQLTQEIADLKQGRSNTGSRGTRSQPSSNPVKCWGCGGLGHLRSACPSDLQTRSGNGMGPRQ